ncbi:MAG: nucleoside monophosphate kinase [Candidatus Kaiserbacteria bacterium]|nr:nucleoside monophosphate kinase [Candidatus Kaiserbacteria bacterium]
MELWILMLFGAPYSGKSTHRKHLCAAFEEGGYEYQVVDVGGMLRKCVQTNNPFTRIITSAAEHGDLVPQEVPISLFFDKLCRGTYDVVITDGIGRRVSEMRTILDALFRCVPEAMLRIDALHLDISWDEIENRFDAGRDEKRLDDTLEVLKKRYCTFRAETLPVIDYIRNCGRVGMHTVTMGNKTEEEVHCEIASRIDITPIHFASQLLLDSYLF